MNVPVETIRPWLPELFWAGPRGGALLRLCPWSPWIRWGGGLMAIPKPTTDFDTQRRVFRRLVKLQDHLRNKGLPLSCLSIGMTDDMDAAIAEGATHVRIGTAIFGARQ